MMFGTDQVIDTAQVEDTDLLAREFIGREFIGREFIGREFIGREFIGREFIGRDWRINGGMDLSEVFHQTSPILSRYFPLPPCKTQGCLSRGRKLTRASIQFHGSSLAFNKAAWVKGLSSNLE